MLDRIALGARGALHRPGGAELRPDVPAERRGRAVGGGAPQGAVRPAAGDAARLLRRAPDRRADQPAHLGHRPAPGRAQPPDLRVRPPDPRAGRRRRAADAGSSPGSRSRRWRWCRWWSAPRSSSGAGSARMTTGVQDELAEATAWRRRRSPRSARCRASCRSPPSGSAMATGSARASQAALAAGPGARRVLRRAHLLHVRRAIVFVLWQGGLLVLEGQLTAGALVSFLLYTITIAAAIGALASQLQRLPGGRRRGGAGVRDPGDEAGDRRSAAPGRAAERRPRDGWRSRASPSATRAIPRCPGRSRRIDLEVAPGEVVALVGPSGGGKTTLVSLLPRFWDVDRGRVRLDGIDIRTLRLADLRGAIGVVPQEPALFSGTIRENIAYARPGAIRGGDRGGGARPRTRTSSSSGCRRATTPWSASAGSSSRVASGSGWRSRGRS